MRNIIATILGLVLAQPDAACATSFLYTFSGTVSYANNADATDIYANLGDPITYSLVVRDSLKTATYTYGPTSSSALGGPDYQAGTLFPVDRRVTIDPSLGYATDFTPLETGFRTDENYSAAIRKDGAAKSLSLEMYFARSIPPEPNCQERCSGTRITHSASAMVFSPAFTSSDFRELGSFDLTGSTGTLADTYSTYLHFGDFYEISLTKLTIARLPDAVPEPSTWMMMIAGLGIIGAASRRRPHVRARISMT